MAGFDTLDPVSFAGDLLGPRARIMEQPTQARSAVRFGVFEFDFRSGELRKQGLKIKLRGQPVQVLAMLLEQAGEVVTREELQRKLWPADTFVDFEQSLNAAVKRLRQALDNSAENPRFVETLARQGYRFISPVHPAGPASRLPEPSPKASTVSQLGTRTRLVGILVVVVLLVAAGGYLVRRLWPRAHVSAGNIRLVVLPFSNYSRDPSQEYLSDGITEEIITQLGSLHPEQLAVIARTSAMRYKSTKIGRELAVDYIVEGSVRRAGDRVRISAQLIQTSEQTHLWAKGYERDLRDILDVENEVARAIADEIRLKLTPQQQARLLKPNPVDPEAYEAYLRGRYYWNKRTSAGLKKGIEYFEQAIEKEPGYAFSYVGLADSWNLLGDYQYLPPRETYPKAREAATKALEMDGTLAEAHTSLAFVMFEYDWDWSGAEREFKKGLELKPSYATGHLWYAYYLSSGHGTNR